MFIRSVYSEYLTLSKIKLPSQYLAMFNDKVAFTVFLPKFFDFTWTFNSTCCLPWFKTVFWNSFIYIENTVSGNFKLTKTVFVTVINLNY